MFSKEKNIILKFYQEDKLLFVILFVLTLLGLIFRFYNYEDRVTFGAEQAISLIHSSKMIREGISLLGLENVQRFTSDGHQIYSGALFSYFLIPIILISKYNPLTVTFIFSLINVASALVLFFVTKEIFGYRSATFTWILFILCSYMIDLSLYIWILALLPFIGVLTIYLLFLNARYKRNIYILLLGLLSGVGVNIEYFYLFTAIFVFATVLWINRKLVPTTLIYLLGFIFGVSTIVVFDIRNEFYHLNTLIKYAQDILISNDSAKLSYYHFLQLVPLVLMFLGVFISKVYLRNKSLAVGLIIFYLLLNLNTFRVDLSKPVGMPKDLTIQRILEAASVIDKDMVDKNFNVAVLVDFDTRGHILRYPLGYIYGIEPRGVSDYPSSNVLYIIAKKEYDFKESDIWEISSYRPYEVTEIYSIGEIYKLYKIQRIGI